MGELVYACPICKKKMEPINGAVPYHTVGSTPATVDKCRGSKGRPIRVPANSW